MKGITPVIAIILLLLITVSMVGFAFVWFTQFMEIASAGAEESVASQTESIRKTVRIENAGTSGVIVRNTGSLSIPVSEISVYIADSLQTATACGWSGDIAVGSYKTCASSCADDEEAKVTSPGTSEDVVICPTD